MDFESHPRVRLRCWGDLAIVDDATGTDLQPRGRKARALLAYLALHPGRPVSRERLTGLLWGDRPDIQARASLRQAVFELKHLAQDGRGLICAARGQLTLDPAMLVTDIDEIAAAAGRGDRAALLAALPDDDEILFANLDGLDEGFDDWLAVERSRRRATLEMLVADGAAATRANAALRPALAALPVPPSARPPAQRRIYPGRLGAIALAAALLPLGALAMHAAAVRSPAQGTAVAAATATPRRTSEELYRTAHRLVATRLGDNVVSAAALLRQAVRIDPGNARAWSDLGGSIRMIADFDHADGAAGAHTASRREAEADVRKALALDPGLADAHAMLGMVLGFASPEARAHIRRAAALDPANAQTQYWLSHLYRNEGDFPRSLAALRRAVAIDPAWRRAAVDAAVAAWELGYREEARGYLARVPRGDTLLALEMRLRLAEARGDYAALIRDAAAARRNGPWQICADQYLGPALLIVARPEPARLLLRIAEPYWPLVNGVPPSPAAFRAIARASGDGPMEEELLRLAMRALLRAGRGGEIAAAYDRGDGLFDGLRSGTPVDFVLYMDYGPDAALGLRAAGRAVEAGALLARLDAAVDRSLAHGRVPAWVMADAAQLWNVEGRHDRALAALRQAVDDGWHASAWTAALDIADLPALAALRGDSQFERIRAVLNARLARERHAAATVIL